jgi:hypothetical protein
LPTKTGFVASQARRHARNLWLANGLMVLISAIIFLANLPRIVEFVTGPHPLDEVALARARDAERVRQYHVRYEPAGDPEIVAKEISGRSWNLTTRWFLAYELAPGGKRFIVKARSEEGSPSYSGTLDPLPRELESHLDPDTIAPAYLDTTSDGWGMTWVSIIALIAAFGLGTANLIRFREQLFHSGEAPLLRAWHFRGEFERNVGELDAEVESQTHLFRDGWKMTPHWIYRSSAFGLKAIRLEDISHAGARTARQGRLWSSLAGPSLAVILRDRFGADAEIPASPDDRDDILRAVAEAAPHAEIHASLGA